MGRGSEEVGISIIELIKYLKVVLAVDQHRKHGCLFARGLGDLALLESG
jgi:hypothetical protein